MGSDLERRAGIDHLQLRVRPIDCAVITRVASESAETHGARFGGEPFLGSVGAGEDEFEPWKHASGINGWGHRAEERALAVVGGRKSTGGAEIALFPVKENCVAVRIAARRGENEGSSGRDGVFGTGIDARWPIFARSGLRAVG